MCRILAVKSKHPVSLQGHLEKFAMIARNSREYQGHGWGCAWLENGKWEVYKNIQPIWETEFPEFPSSTLFLVHARSAFRDEGIAIENNMPFYDEKNVFIFNGELHGVKIKTEGRIGAEKIFNYLKRFNQGDLLAAVVKGVTIIQNRSNYIRAMNILMSDQKKIYLVTQFNEDNDYFTMHRKQTDEQLIICSYPYPNETGWHTIDNNTIEVYV